MWARPSVLKTNLLAPVSLFYERTLTRHLALQASARWLSYTARHNQWFVNAALEARFYLDGAKRLEAHPHTAGFYMSLYLKARYLRYINEIGYGFNKVGDLDEVVIRSLGFGLTLGHQWVGRRGFTGDVFIGGGTLPPALSQYEHTMRYSGVTSTNGFDYYSLDLRVGVSLGYAF